jgi:hypothetical protein
MINGWWQDVTFTVQEGQAHEWCPVIDTGKTSPDDVRTGADHSNLQTGHYLVRERSIAVLVRG